MYSRFEPEVTSELMTPEARRMLENYLQRACSAEEAVVDPQEQAELRAEMSGHILALAMAHQELGASPEEAMRAALKQFGQADLIGEAVAREIGERPSLLGSPITLSMIGGLLINWATLSGASSLLAHIGLEAISPEGHTLGLVLGVVTGAVLWKKRLAPAKAATWNARFCAGTTLLGIAALFAAACLSGRNLSTFLTPEWIRLAGPVLFKWLVVAGVTGACGGALTSLWCRCVRNTLSPHNNSAITKNSKRLSAP